MILRDTKNIGDDFETRTDEQNLYILKSKPLNHYSQRIGQITSTIFAMDFPGGKRKRRTNIRAQLKIRNIVMIDFKKFFY